MSKISLGAYRWDIIFRGGFGQAVARRGAALTCLTASSPRPAYAHRLPLSISIACGEEGYEVERSAAVIASFGARHISSEGDMLRCRMTVGSVVRTSASWALSPERAASPYRGDA